MLTSSNSTSIYISLQSSLPPPTPAFFVFFFSFFKLVTVPSHGWLQRGNARTHFSLVNYTVAEQTVRGSHVEYTYTDELDLCKDCEDFSTKQSVGRLMQLKIATWPRLSTRRSSEDENWEGLWNAPAALAAQIRGGFDPPAAFTWTPGVVLVVSAVTRQVDATRLTVNLRTYRWYTEKKRVIHRKTISTAFRLTLNQEFWIPGTQLYMSKCKQFWNTSYKAHIVGQTYIYMNENMRMHSSLFYVYPFMTWQDIF